MRQFKARIESVPSPDSKQRESMHAAEFWFQSDNIVAASRFIHDIILPLGFDDCNVTKLIDITPEEMS